MSLRHAQGYGELHLAQRSPDHHHEEVDTSLLHHRVDATQASKRLW